MDSWIARFVSLNMLNMFNITLNRKCTLCNCIIQNITVQHISIHYLSSANQEIGRRDNYWRKSIQISIIIAIRQRACLLFLNRDCDQYMVLTSQLARAQWDSRLEINFSGSLLLADVPSPPHRYNIRNFKHSNATPKGNDPIENPSGLFDPTAGDSTTRHGSRVPSLCPVLPSSSLRTSVLFQSL